ncbi:PD-(D/E)XK nuclease family protein [Natronococcus occultus]|uniref:Uncharacterized protein n=1 Tax=Natronococcus occultus SP4 TaxID=694430 RepID=L0JY24_9EURY|nr:hypothetical protein [Natronococcus occultus]AGB36753.1 hypothetical protein Natoc_0904 [Natronococcus occultus SP4]
MTAQTDSPGGTLHILPFDGGSLAARVADIYADAFDAGREPEDILVLKRLPTGVPEFTADLREQADLQTRPNVKSLPRHATTVLEEARPDATRLSYEERIEFLARILDGYNWSSYFEGASDHDSFGRDVGQLLLEATWQGGFDVPEDGGEYDDYLRELEAVNEFFHEKLRERGLIEQAETISEAIDALERPSVREHIEREFDVVVVVEFEECSPIDRRYLHALAHNAELICVAEEHASIERLRTESGSVRQLAAGLSVVDHTTDGAETAVSIPTPESESAGRAFGRFLATGTCDDLEGTARQIRTTTLDGQVEEVANEIEHLRRSRGWEYDEFAVLLRTIGDPMPRVRRILRHSGVPTASAGVSGLAQDLAVRELHALAQYHIDGRERAYELLESRVPAFDTELVEDCVVRNSISKSLKRWIVTTDLKRRIAADSSDIDAREQFQNVSRLLSIAEFVDAQDILDNDWTQFATMLERAITYDAPYAHTAEVNVPEGGVTVGDVGIVKNDSRKAVFLLNVVDAEYPGTETLSPLFPTAWIKQMEGYPAVTNPTAEDVAATYATASEPDGNEFERYYDELARRQLAIGARAAEDVLYFCTYRRADGSMGRLQHRSRYLHEIESHPSLTLEEVEGAGVDRDLHTLGSASSEILAQPWTELERIQAEASTGGEVALESAEETLAAIQAVLEEGNDVDPRFERAVETQFDLARGAIRPEVDRTRGPEEVVDDD